MKNKDQIYSEVRDSISDFKFNQEVVHVFDDMLDRSIPDYASIIEEQVDLIEKYYQKNTIIYDLGCSLGTLSFKVANRLQDDLGRIIAIDASSDMIQECQNRSDSQYKIEFIQKKVEEVNFESASVICLNFTLQFVDRSFRNEILKRIYNSLLPGGILLFSEKISHDDSDLQDLMVERYHCRKKRQGYSEIEIQQKQKALQNILIPESWEFHQQRLHQVGFEKILCWKTWYNFISVIAIKV